MICCRCFAEACCQDTISFGFVTGHLKENLGFATKRRYRPFDKWLFPLLTIMFNSHVWAAKWLKMVQKDPKWKRIFSQIVMVSYSSLIYYSSRFVSLLLIFYVLSVVRRLFLANCLNRVVIINHPLLQATLKTHWLKMTHTLLFCVCHLHWLCSPFLKTRSTILQECVPVESLPSFPPFLFLSFLLSFSWQHLNNSWRDFPIVFGSSSSWLVSRLSLRQLFTKLDFLCN